MFDKIFWNNIKFSFDGLGIFSTLSIYLFFQ